MGYFVFDNLREWEGADMIACQWRVNKNSERLKSTIGPRQLKFLIFSMWGKVDVK